MNSREERIAETLEKLSPGVCGNYLAARERVQLTSLLNQLVYERLEDKFNRADYIYRSSGQNWNQALYTLLFRYIGDLPNRETYMELARRAGYMIVLREKNSLPLIEALLYGTSGLLATFRPDDYIRLLRTEFEHLQAKYDITPLDPGQWNTKDIRPQNMPDLRIAQLSQFLLKHDFIFDRTIACRNRNDVHRLFDVEASDYWAKERHTRIGKQKKDIFGINLVAVLQCAYGSYTGDDTLRERAIALLEDIPAEENKKVDLWRSHGVRPRNAYDTQGLLQLDGYCAQKRCEQCPVARQIIEKTVNRT